MPGDGDCLIWSLLSGLHHVLGNFNKDDSKQKLLMHKHVKRCRAALIKLPSNDPRKPQARDLVSNAYKSTASKSEHDRSYLQFDVHAEWVLRYLLHILKREIPRRGIRLVCFSRFDDILGGPETILIQQSPENMNENVPLEIQIYNHTGSTYSGYHYDLVVPAVDVPPPPAPPREPNSGRPTKRIRSVQNDIQKEDPTSEIGRAHV